MLRNYSLIALRHLRKHLGYTLINVGGFAIGLAGFLLVFLYVQHELSFDQYHEYASRIYRVIAEQQINDNKVRGPETSGSLGPAIINEIPEIQWSARIFPHRVQSIEYQKQEFQVESHFAEISLFHIFSFPIIAGSITNFNRPNTVLLTISLARRIFGQENPIGKVITIPGYGATEVVGILEDIPKNSHFTFDLLISFNTLPKWLMPWGAHQFWTYILVPDGYSITELEHKLLDIKSKNWGIENVNKLKFKYELQPLTSIYFSKERSPQKGDIRYIYLFSAIAIIILLMACANYTSLTVAKLNERVKEVGIRKVFGAYRRHLIVQFLGESLLITFIAMPLALLFVEFALPLLQVMSQKTIEVDWNGVRSPIMIATGSALIIGIIAGSYPAILLSAPQTSNVLRRQLKKHITAARFQKGLVIFQFIIAVTLVNSTLIIQNQMEYIQDRDLGFEKENVIILKIPSLSHNQQWRAMKEVLLQNHYVTNASASAGTFGGFSGMVLPVYGEGVGGDNTVQMKITAVDEDFLTTMGMRLVEGRNFSLDILTDATKTCILNESAMRYLGWTSAVNKSIMLGKENVSVIGVVKNFHYESLHNEIGPMIFRIMPSYFYILSVRIKPGDLKEVLATIHTIWQQFLPDKPFTYSFLENDLDTLYQKDLSIRNTFMGFSGLAIIISFLGLFGLSVFTAKQKTKEVGIRKVLGATIFQIITLLSKEFMLLVLIAIIISSPITYYIMNIWLQDYAYRVHINIATFFLSSGIAMILMLLSISYQVIKAAQTDPAKTLRYE